MEDNWYETTVSASLPHRILSVVDWASDSSIPLRPSPESYSEEGQLPPLSSFVPTGSNGPSCSTSSKKVGGRFRMGKAVADLRKMKSAKTAYSNLVNPIQGPALPIIPTAWYNVFPWGTNDPVEAVERKAMRETSCESTHTL